MMDHLHSISVSGEDRTEVKLVEDLVPLIIASRTWSSTDLTNMARVSPAWLFPVRHLLYSEVHCFTVEALKRLHRTLRHNSYLAERIHSFDMELQKVTNGSLTITDEKLISLLGRLFSCFTHLKTFTVKGLVAMEFFQSGLIHLPCSTRLNELSIEVRGRRRRSRVALRGDDRLLDWTSGDAASLQWLKHLKLQGVAMVMESSSSARKLLPSLEELTLKNAFVSDALSLTTSSNLTRITVINQVDKLNTGTGLPSIFKALLQRYGSTLEHLTYQTLFDPSPLSDLQGWELPKLPRLRKLHTEGVYFNLHSPGMILVKCPELEEWVVSQRRPEELVEDFVTHISVMPPNLRRAKFSRTVIFDIPGQPSVARRLSPALMKKARQIGQSRNIEVDFDRGECMA